jgi:hypothetical protein
MQNHDLIAVRQVLIGSRKPIAATVIGERFSGVRIIRAPFLLLTSAALVMLSAALVVFSMLNNSPGKRNAFLCGTHL